MLLSRIVIIPVQGQVIFHLHDRPVPETVGAAINSGYFVKAKLHALSVTSLKMFDKVRKPKTITICETVISAQCGNNCGGLCCATIAAPLTVFTETLPMPGGMHEIVDFRGLRRAMAVAMRRSQAGTNSRPEPFQGCKYRANQAPPFCAS
ncbi:MAG: hypothetical protein WCS20_04705 [Alphaproteobacteria bacterium]